MNIDTKRIRKTLILNQKELAGILDVKEPTISIWESGKSKPSAKHARALKELCDKNNLNFYDFVLED